jgi:hypothetical protein
VVISTVAPRTDTRIRSRGTPRASTHIVLERFGHKSERSKRAADRYFDDGSKIMVVLRWSCLHGGFRTSFGDARCSDVSPVVKPEGSGASALLFRQRMLPTSDSAVCRRPTYRARART